MAALLAGLMLSSAVFLLIFQRYNGFLKLARLPGDLWRVVSAPIGILRALK